VTINLKRSKALFEEASQVIPSGVNSTARARFSGWEPHPIFAESGTGSHLYDVDGNRYIDYLLGLGPMLFGHRPTAITEAVVDQIRNVGTVFALPTEAEAELARKLMRAVPSLEMVHLANTGTEAVLYAIRIARAATGRTKLVRFEGMYHGFSDAVYWSKHPDLTIAGPLLNPTPIPQGPGLPKGIAESLIILPWNNESALERAFAEHGDEIAAIVTEPVMCNTGCILPNPGYLELLQGITHAHGSILIFDEVITGFRVALGGAQAYYGVKPDISVFAKGMGGGFPIAAVGGRRDLMEFVSDGTVSMAGTYSGNGIAVAAANATLDIMLREDIHTRLFQLSTELQEGLSKLINFHELPAFVTGIGPVFQIWFSEHPISSYRDAARFARADLFRIWWEEMLSSGVLFHPGHLENLFVSFAHTEEDVADTLAAADMALYGVKQRGEF
jgi:glutamate-1-semialdehyde 2,1-aminomutase